MGGIPTPKIVAILNERHNHSMPVMETAHRKEELFEAYIPKILPVEPVVEVIRAYEGKLPMAVATGGMRYICEKTLRALNLWDKFQAVVTADDVEHGKPAPDIFLEAARLLRLEPKDCMAFEDANLGIQSATAAGMLVVDVRPLIKR
jgi:HAD superfamily hydrolase (TIGR01509 family)